MTANRAEQKEGGSMAGITTAEREAELAAAGWVVLEDDINGVYFHHPETDMVFHTYEGAKWKKALAAQASLAAVLGIAPPGYVMVPVEVAKEAESALVLAESEVRTAARSWARNQMPDAAAEAEKQADKFTQTRRAIVVALRR